MLVKTVVDWGRRRIYKEMKKREVGLRAGQLYNGHESIVFIVPPEVGDLWVFYIFLRGPGVLLDVFSILRLGELCLPEVLSLVDLVTSGSLFENYINKLKLV